MLEIRDGVECFNLKEQKVLITPDLTRIRIPLDMEFPPSDLEKLPEKTLKRFKKRGIIVDSKINKKKPKYYEICLLNKITFKNLDSNRAEFIFSEFLKNCGIAPYITIDCSFEVTSKLLDLISQKYNENSINPVVKILIKEQIVEFIELLKKYIEARDSIELNNLFLIIQHNIINSKLIKEIRDKIDPIEIFDYYENITDGIKSLKDFNSNFELQVLIELNEKIKDFDFTIIKESSLLINDDSISRLLNALNNRTYLKNENFKKEILLPYCSACNSRLFIEGDGKIYACNTGYRNNDQIAQLKNKSLKEILNSEKFKKIRNKIKENSLKCQKISCLANFYSGCLYTNKFGKIQIIKKILHSFIE